MKSAVNSRNNVKSLGNCQGFPENQGVGRNNEVVDDSRVTLRGFLGKNVHRFVLRLQKISFEIPKKAAAKVTSQGYAVQMEKAIKTPAKSGSIDATRIERFGSSHKTSIKDPESINVEKIVEIINEFEKIFEDLDVTTIVMDHTMTQKQQSP
ncbi:unnamed protein product [Didymodactylos carnosus]|uniref:Uncharacterized protein n=1 Tax=Didymodactylos carnosus TaxID=1234261 RepID=A0A813Q646_9BILA|nr:unnamed protein product [Didymodactylos carnosus]CAF1279134.1 unnamed protein product [Didymodactylos carnosus]CAF3543772.1 unnamed protein product [Didymodactylos carnosus]CAF4084035.1 unnamed protein product [Didymodactylos carnosus]